MPDILLQQSAQSRDGLLLHPCLVKFLVALEGLSGVQGQQLHRRFRPEQIGQGGNTHPDAIL